MVLSLKKIIYAKGNKIIFVTKSKKEIIHQEVQTTFNYLFIRY